MMRKLFPFLFLAMLAGCGTKQEIIRTQEIEVPVPVPCRVTDAQIEKPAQWALDQIPLNADLEKKLRAALIEVEQRAEYEIRLESVIAACRRGLDPR